jgi:hypothetical protein
MDDFSRGAPDGSSEHYKNRARQERDRGGPDHGLPDTPFGHPDTWLSNREFAR